MKAIILQMTDREFSALAAAQIPRSRYPDDSFETLATREIYLLISAHLRSLKNGVDMLAAFGHVDLGRKPDDRPQHPA